MCVFPCHFPADPVSYAEGLLKLKSQHRLEQANLENQLDGEHAKQLAQLREQLVEGTEGKLSEVERETCLLYTSPSPRDISGSRMPSSA